MSQNSILNHLLTVEVASSIPYISEFKYFRFVMTGCNIITILHRSFSLDMFL